MKQFVYTKIVCSCYGYGTYLYLYQFFVAVYSFCSVRCIQYCINLVRVFRFVKKYSNGAKSLEFGIHCQTELQVKTKFFLLAAANWVVRSRQSKPLSKHNLLQISHYFFWSSTVHAEFYEIMYKNSYAKVMDKKLIFKKINMFLCSCSVDCEISERFRAKLYFNYSFKKHFHFLNTQCVAFNKVGFLYLKVPKCENFHRTDFLDFFTIKPLWVGHFRGKIKN